MDDQLGWEVGHMNHPVTKTLQILETTEDTARRVIPRNVALNESSPLAFALALTQFHSGKSTFHHS